ncbi:MAG: hypothetical protein JO167_03450, partial [Alphaproteobacteria bacterium]|nr:hypothetical protein [Alphaproteobacteria bacterium]
MRKTLLACAILAAASAAQAQEGCNLTRAASLDMTIESSGRIIVPVGI